MIDTSGEAVLPELKATLFFGIYESAETRFIKRYLRSDLDVVELGSSLGVLTSHISRRIRGPHRIVALEANPILIPYIERNVAINSPTVPLSVLHGALYYATNGEPAADWVDFSVARDHTVSRLSDGRTALPAVKVKSYTLQNIVLEHGITDFALVSDIEGAEAGLIESEIGILKHCKQAIIELHDTCWNGTHYSVEELRSLLVNRHGFTERARRGPIFAFDRVS